MTKALFVLTALFVMQAQADDVQHPLLEHKGAWPLDTTATAKLQPTPGMSHIYKVTGEKGNCWNLSVTSPEFAPTIVVAKGKAAVAFGAYVSPETVDEYGRIFTSAAVKDRKWVTAMSVCSDQDGDVYFIVGRGWVWVEQPTHDHSIVQKLERQGGLGGEYTVYGHKYN